MEGESIDRVDMLDVDEEWMGAILLFQELLLLSYVNDDERLCVKV